MRRSSEVYFFRNFIILIDYLKISKSAKIKNCKLKKICLNKYF